jgi:dolichol-phosphate mannosyltransferase
MASLQRITILIPLYNETAVLPLLFERLDKLQADHDVFIDFLLVDDGSKDDTSQMIANHAYQNEAYSAISLSRNFGHSRAITAGLAQIGDDTDAVFIMDADLQDPPELLNEFISKMNEGFDVVYGIRKNRKESWFKRFCYHIYYRVQKKFSNISMPLDAGDFSLIRRNVVRHLQQMPEESRYLRGLRSWVGYRQTGIAYERSARLSGETKYSYRSLFKLAFNGLFNFSEMPVRLIGIAGMAAIIPSLFYLLITLYKKLVFGTVPEGFTALVFAIVLFSGVQLLSLSIIGEYVLRIFFQVKQRPLFIIKSKIIKGKSVNE